MPTRLPTKGPKKKPNNPKLAEASKATQFKPGNKAQKDAGIAPWSYRSQLQYLAAREIDVENLDAEIRALLQPSGPKGNRKKVPISRVLMVRLLERALKKVEAKIIAQVIENTEGKMLQPISITPPDKAPTDFVSDEDAARAYKEHISK